MDINIIGIGTVCPILAVSHASNNVSFAPTFPLRIDKRVLPMTPYRA